jgi:type VI secretion system FHA domain protein
MILTLEVMGEQADDLGAASRKVFDSIGGTIGRLPDNDWVFPDPYVSGRHALIRYLNGKFFVEDTSTNGVFVNSPDNRIPRTQAYQLKDGDLLYIDAYRIQVSIAKPTVAKAKDDDPFELLKARARGPREDKTIAMPPSVENDRTAALARRGEDVAMAGVEWFGAGEVQAPPKRATATNTATKRSGAGADHDDWVHQMLAAAGIEGVEPSAELARTLGSMLRTSIGGVMDLLRARERMKDDMRLRGTTFKAQHNNPLKFSANVADAFHNMLVKNNPAYLAPADACDDALHDVRDHQAAIVAAMRLAFESMLAQFDPTRLQDDFDRQLKKGSILGVPAKLRYWDLYREKYGELAKDADASFHALFGEEFAKAYEDQLERLQALARNRQK